MDTKQLVLAAKEHGIVIPAYNIPYLPMVKPIVAAVADEDSLAMIQVARVEWEKFSSGSLEDVAAEYRKYEDKEHTVLHLDHVPVIDEDYKEVDYTALIKRALVAGFKSVMVDGSRLKLDDNIAVTKIAADIAHGGGVPIEAELGAVMGHESGPMPPYEEIFRTKQGFTDTDEAVRFVHESGCDWLSVAVGNIHGAVADGLRDQKKPEARLDIDHIRELSAATGIPLVLHGGSGINPEYVRAGFAAGIAKINVGTELRQAYESGLAAGNGDIEIARNAVYKRTRELISDTFRISGTRKLIFG